MRPRKKDRHLPACMYFKHGAYYLVRKGKWKRLDTDYQASLMLYAREKGRVGKGGMAELIDDAMTYMKPKLAANTISQYEAAAEKLKDQLAEFEPRDVLPRHVAAIKMHGAATPNMNNRVISFLRMVFAYALEKGLVDSNPCIGIKRHAEKKRDRYLTDAEFHAICEVASDNMRSIYEMCYLTGQRISDVLNIRLADISDEGIYFAQQKTKARLIVRMTPDLQALIARIKALPRKVRGLTLFTARSAGKPVSYDTAKQAFRVDCRKAKVKGATLHDLRAKSLTDTDKQGNNAQKLGGHTDAKMTARYLRLREIDIAEPPTLPKKSL